MQFHVSILLNNKRFFSWSDKCDDQHSDKNEEERKRHTVQERHIRHKVLDRSITDRAQNKAGNTTDARSLFAYHAEYEYTQNTRRDKALELLDKLKYAAKSWVIKLRCNQTADHSKDTNTNPANLNLLRLSSFLVYILVIYIDSKDRLRRVKHRS
jgi:hypothetical protein